MSIQWARELAQVQRMVLAWNSTPETSAFRAVVVSARCITIAAGLGE